jgi:hypothetical protein
MMELGPVRTAVPGVTQPTPPAPAPVQTAAPPQLGRARAVEATVDTVPVGPRRSQTVGLASLPPAPAFAPPPAAAAGEDGETAVQPSRQPVSAPLLCVQRRFDMDDSSKQLVFRMIDVNTGEVVRQLPQEDRLRLQQMLRAFGAIAPAGRTALYDGSA